MYRMHFRASTTQADRLGKHAISFLFGYYYKVVDTGDSLHGPVKVAATAVKTPTHYN